MPMLRRSNAALLQDVDATLLKNEGGAASD